jgi:hypothetical protein
MANELPYFRFTVQAWQNGKVSLEDYNLKGLFIDVCGYYWVQDCSITIAMLEKRFRDAKGMLKELIELEIIKVDNEGNITIEFLNEQFDLLSEKRKKRQLAGKKGGLSKSSNAKAMLKQSSSYKDKDNNKDKDKDKDKKRKKKEVIFPFDSNKFKQHWQIWKDYKKTEHKFQYKSEESEQAALKKLNKLADGIETTAIDIIDQSLENGWKGFFKLKTEHNGRFTEELSPARQALRDYAISRKDL